MSILQVYGLAAMKGCDVSSAPRLDCVGVVFDPTDDDFVRLLVAGFAVELEQPQIVAVRAFLFGRRGQVRSVLSEQVAEPFQLLVES